MYKTQPIQIIEVIDKMTQGLSEPILCKCENNEEYIVKGLGAGRSSQISEREWSNLACDLPVNYDFKFMRQALERCMVKGKLWEGV